jgi:hypothetical protein
LPAAGILLRQTAFGASANAAQPQSPRRACGAAGVAALMPDVLPTPTRRRPRLRRDAAGGCAGRSVVPRWRGWRRRLCLSLGDAASYSGDSPFGRSLLVTSEQLTVAEAIGVGHYCRCRSFTSRASGAFACCLLALAISPLPGLCFSVGSRR